MASTPTDVEKLNMDLLVTIAQDIEPYVIQWPSQVEVDGALEVSVLVAMKRPDGVLLVFPSDALPADEVAAGRQHGGGLLGPSAEFEVPSVVVEGGVMSPTGDTVKVLVVDCLADVVEIMRLPQHFEDIAYNFDPESEYAVPDPGPLLDAILNWISTTDPAEGLAFYTADERPEEEEALQTPPRRRPQGKAAPGGLPKHKPEKSKRVTTASLAASMEVLMQQLPTMASQLAEISEKQKKLENQLNAPISASCPALAQPLSHVVPTRASVPLDVAKHVAPPPRTMAMPSPGILRSPGMHQPQELAALEQEKSSSQLPPEGHPLAQAVLAQSQALTNLVSQIATSSADPMLDLAGVSSTGTRGSTGRAKLQAELASQRGSFFTSVMQSMSRRMNPTLPASSNPVDLMQQGVCGTKYLERFGGYARHRDLGQIQYQVMQILDYLQVENVQAARDATALLAVTLEQAVMDNGRFELAAVLCLQDDLPSSIFINRNAGAFSRSRSFSPLADQRWITIALAYLKELDALQTKRAELTGSVAKTPPASQTPPSTHPKAKAAGKKKGKGKGGSNQNQAPAEEGEEA